MISMEEKTRGGARKVAPQAQKTKLPKSRGETKEETTPGGQLPHLALHLERRATTTTPKEQTSKAEIRSKEDQKGENHKGEGRNKVPKMPIK